MNNYLPEGKLTYTLRDRHVKNTVQSVRDAMFDSRISEARVILCDSEHNLHVDLGCMRGIIPKNECAVGIADGSVKDIAVISRVNKNVCFKVTDVREQADGSCVAILSRRLAQEECMSLYTDKLEAGDVIDARVTHLESFGAFCDIGCGIPALLPIDGISVSRIPHPSAVLHVGQNIRAVVKSRDAKNRITLTHKELLGTWEENAALFHVGDTVPGIVRSVEKYGIFVELMPNLAGLAELTEGIEAGMCASVYIKSIIPEKMKIKLVIVDCFDGDSSPAELRYFFKGDHMDSFEYSPASSEKQIVFGFCAERC